MTLTHTHTSNWKCYRWLSQNLGWTSTCKDSFVRKLCALSGWRDISHKTIVYTHVRGQEPSVLPSNIQVRWVGGAIASCALCKMKDVERLKMLLRWGKFYVEGVEDVAIPLVSTNLTLDDEHDKDKVFFFNANKLQLCWRRKECIQCITMFHEHHTVNRS